MYDGLYPAGNEIAQALYMLRLPQNLEYGFLISEDVSLRLSDSVRAVSDADVDDMILAEMRALEEAVEVAASECGQAKRVSISGDPPVIYEVQPYSEIYSMHPKIFNFDAQGTGNAGGSNEWLNPCMAWRKVQRRNLGEPAECAQLVVPVPAQV